MSTRPGHDRSRRILRAACLGAAVGALFGAFAVLSPLALGPDAELPSAAAVGAVFARGVRAGGPSAVLTLALAVFGAAPGAALGGLAGAVLAWLIDRGDRGPAV